MRDEDVNGVGETERAEEMFVERQRMFGGEYQIIIEFLEQGKVSGCRVGSSENIVYLDICLLYTSTILAQCQNSRMYFGYGFYTEAVVSISHMDGLPVELSLIHI